VNAFAFATDQGTATSPPYLSSMVTISSKSPRVVLYAPILIRVDVPEDLAHSISAMIK